MDYPDCSVWRLVLLSPKMWGRIALFLMWDHFILGGALPYLASYGCSYFISHSSLRVETEYEILALVFVVFLMIFLTIRLGIEVWFWRKLFLMEQQYYCILAVRDLCSCYTMIAAITQLVKIIYGSQEHGLRVHNLGEGTLYILLSRLVQNYEIPITDSFVASTMPTDAMCTTCLHNHIAENSAKLYIAVAMLSSCVARLLYINSLYSYMSAVDLLSELDPFLQIQLRFDERNGNMQPGPPAAFSRPNNLPRAGNTGIGNSTPPHAPPTSSSQIFSGNSPNPTWGWPLSFFREDVAESFPG